MSHTARLPANAEGVGISIAAKKIVNVCPLILAVVIESRKEASSRRKKELNIGCGIPSSKSPGLNLAEIPASCGPIQPGSDVVLKGEIDSIRVLISNQSAGERVTARVVEAERRSSDLLHRT